MRVLVTFASRHGATREIAAVLARRLHRSLARGPGGSSVALLPVHSRPDVAASDVVVLGSPVYDGRWLPEALAFADAHAAELGSRPLWLFSSGMPVAPPVGDLLPGTVGVDGPWLDDALGARGHRIFPGRLEPRLLGHEERRYPLAAASSGADRRDWAAVLAWADEVAGASVATPVG